MSAVDTAPVIAELRQVLFHEYAHFHVALAAGVPGYITIEKNTSGRDDEKAYIGKFKMLAHLDPRDWRWRRKIGLAGAVAEALLEDQDVEAWTLAEDGYLREYYGFSESDHAMADPFTEEDIHRTISMVRRCWPVIQHDVELHLALLAREVSTQEAVR